MLSFVRRRRPSPALLVAIAAVIVASAGSATAAHYITTKDIKNGTIRETDLSRAVRSKLNLAGRPGPQGPQGPPGNAVGWARVPISGGVDGPHTYNITAMNITHPYAGTYCFIGLPFAVRNAVASVGLDGTGITAAVELGDTSHCPGGSNATVTIYDADGFRADSNFMIVFQ